MWPNLYQYRLESYEGKTLQWGGGLDLSTTEMILSRPCAKEGEGVYCSSHQQISKIKRGKTFC